MLDTEYRWMSETEERLWWFEGKRRFIRAVLPPPSGNLTILDVGAGTGGMSTYLERWGDVTRIEYSPVAQRYLKKRHIPFVAADITAYALPADRYDLVTCLDVLYHHDIGSDTRVLGKLYRAVKPGGTILITDCARPELYGPHDIRNRARERYLLPELVEKVTSAGFTVRRQSYTFFGVFPLFVLSRLTDRLHGKTAPASRIPVYNGYLSSLCRIEADMLRHVSFPIGSSVILTATKPLRKR